MMPLRRIATLLLLTDAQAFGLGGGGAAKKSVDAMLQAVTVPEKVVALVESRSQRTLIRGACAVFDEPKVLRSVEILYEDLAIFRPAGNLLLRQLRSSASDAQRLYDDLSAAGYKALDSALPALRRLFDAMDNEW